jgi:hypothetical protein
MQATRRTNLCKKHSNVNKVQKTRRNSHRRVSGKVIDAKPGAFLLVLTWTCVSA